MKKYVWIILLVLCVVTLVSGSLLVIPMIYARKPKAKPPGHAKPCGCGAKVRGMNQ